MKSYDHKKIEGKWQKEWERSGLYTVRDAEPGKENFFLLVEFPYPSGNLHVGHWYAFAVPDMLARMYRMQGKNVLFPIGFDAFGLPAENAAIKNKLNPRTWTEGNMAHMKDQVRSMGTSFDWSREVVTCDPSYYRWTQWQFNQFLKKGLAYRKETAVNWCPSCKTVLANEQVVDGKCERCSTEVIQKEMLQWNLKIRDYADRLVDDLDALDWPEQIKDSQRNWIGRSEGAEIDFPLPDAGIERFILLHGKGGSPETNFLPWLKRVLEKRGYAVEAPSLPNASEPNDEEQADFVQKHCTLDEKTAVVGHSFGGIVALRLLERGIKLGRVTLVGTPYSGVFIDKKERPTVSAAVQKGFNAGIIRANAKGIAALYDTDDHAVPLSDGDSFAKELDCYLMKVQGEASHFGASEEPWVLRMSAPSITVFTTRPDTLFGATYLVLAPEHPWVARALAHKTILQNNDEVAAYVNAAMRKTELERQETKEKSGVELKGVKARNPATGEDIPIHVADYVLGGYGTGAIMAVPAHDERDYEFATKFGLPVRQVIRPVFGWENKMKGEMVYRDTVSAVVRRKDGNVMLLNWPKNKWITTVIGGIEAGETPAETAEREVLEETGYKAKAVFTSPITIESFFYADHKQEWRWRVDTPVLLELTDEEPGEVASEEREKHTPLWVTPEEARNSIMYGNNKLAVDLALGRIGAYTEPLFGERAALVGSGDFDGMTPEEAKHAMTETFGRGKKTYRLRDWVVSRQRYWGVPIPVIHCEACGAVPVPDKDLPVLLPEVEDYLPEGSGKSPLAKAREWVEVSCPSCGGKAERETDTLDTFVDSSWYFLRYTDPKNTAEFAAREKQNAWMPVNLYSGGAEHTTMHVLYSRFWHKALYDLGFVADQEPYARRMNRSLIMGPDGQKMSKSRGNVIDPDEVVERLGADTVRMYLAFIGPYNEVGSYPWNPDGVVGVRRFIERVWKAEGYVQDGPNDALERPLHKALKKVSEDNALLKFNTAISAMMIFLNALEKEKRIGKGQWETFLKMLAPFAPHVAEELWHADGHDSSIHLESWPVFDPSLARDERATVAVQVSGKTRATVEVEAGADESAHEAAARAAVAERLQGQEVVRVVVVRGRLVNFVLKGN